jgi:hypothetical protein
MAAQLSASVEIEGRKWREWEAGGAAWHLREGELSAARTRGGHAAFWPYAWSATVDGA